MLCFILLGFSQCFHAQNTVWPEQLEVTASSLKLRDKPSLDAKVLTSIPNGAVVDNLTQHGEDRPEWDNIDGIDAPWMKVRYKAQTGFAFGAYLKTDFYLFYENSVINYVPNVKNWYALFKTPKGDELRKVLVYSAFDTVETDDRLHEMIRIDGSERSSFIIGTDKDLNTGIVGDYNLRHKQWGEQNDFRYEINPGKTVSLMSLYETFQRSDAYFELAGTGSFDLGKQYLEQHDFKIWATQKPNYNSTYAITQDLTPFFDPRENSCTLKWWGDLDGDGKPDVIFGRCTTGEGGCTDYLFLSSKAKTGEIMHPAAAFYWGMGC